MFARSSLVSLLVVSSFGALGCARATEEAPRPALAPASCARPIVASTPSATPLASTPAIAATATTPATATATAASVTLAPRRASSSAGLRVKRLVVTRGVRGREPAEVEALKVEDAPLYAFVELANAGDGDQQVTVTFEPERGASVGFVELAVPARTHRWRTWARTGGVKKAGVWNAVVRGVDGKELARERFELGATTPVVPTAARAASSAQPS